MVDYTVTLMTQLLPLVNTSPLHNKHDGVNIAIFDQYLSI